MPQGGLYLFLGTDRVQKLQRIEQLQREFRIGALDRHHVDGKLVSSKQLVALCRQRPAEGPLRLIAVDRAGHLDGRCVDALIRHADTIAQSACVVLLVETQLAGYHPLAPYQRQIVSNRTSRSPKKCVKSESPIQTERFSAQKKDAPKPFALTGALGNRDVAGAFLAIRDQLSSGKDPLEVLGLITWQLQRWALVRRLMDSGESPSKIAVTTNLQPWQVERISSEVARRPLSSLQELLLRCWQVDCDTKKGCVLPTLAVEQLAAEVCMPKNTSGRASLNS